MTTTKAAASGKTWTVNFKITLQFYGYGRPYVRVIEDERYRFASKGSAKAWVKRYIINEAKPDGYVIERMAFFYE